MAVMTSPINFFTAFRQSSWYHAAYTLFYQGKTVAADVTDAEKRQVFEESEAAKEALVTYAQEEGGFVYDPAAFAAESQEAIASYLAVVRRQRTPPAGASRDLLEAVDAERTQRHLHLAATLAKNGEAPDELLGRTLGRLILVTAGLDTYASAREPYATRLKRATP